MIPVSGGAGDDNSDGDFCSSSSRSNNNNQRLLKEAIRSCDSSPATAHLKRIFDESSRQSDHVDDDDETLLQIKPRTEASPELALSHSSPLTLPTDSTLTRNSNLISNGNNNNKSNNNNRVHVDDNYNYQQQHHTTICTEQEEQHQLNNNHHYYNQQQLLYNTGDSNSYQEEEEEEQYHNHPGDLSESLSSLYLPTLSRQLGTTIMSGLNWINQIDFNNLLQSLVNPSSIFRRRNSATPIISPQGKSSGQGAAHNGATLASPLSTTTTTGNGSSISSPPQLQPYSSSTLQTKLVAKMLNGALLKPQLLRQSQEETIELESFGVVELDNDESGIGHDFQRYENDKPTWCDACAEFLTPPVMNDSSGGSKANANDVAAADSEASTFNTNNTSEGKTTSTTTAETATATTTATAATSTSAPVAVQTDHLMRTYLQCRRCAYVCHLKCTPIIRINCRPAVSAVASGSPPGNYRRRSSAGNPSSRRSQRLQRNSVRFDGGSLFPLEAKQQQQQPQPTKELLVQEEEENRPSKEMNHIGEQEEEEGKSSQPSSNLSSPEDSSKGFEEDGGYPMSTSVTMSSIATEDDLLVASSLPTDTASVFVDSRTLEGGGVTEDEDATLCDESSSGENSTAADLPPNDDVTFTLVNGQQPNLEAAAAQVQQVDSRTYTKKMQQQQQNSKSLQSAAAAELLTPASITELRGKILRYNERIRGRGSGLGITLIDETKQLFRGFLRVHMNLTRPINVIAGKRPPSIYDIINEEEGNNNNNNNPNNPNLNQQQQQRRTLTSFYMPRDTVKNIHITSESTSLQVIKAMLKKFKVVDNPQKFALYLRRRFPEEELQQQQAKEGEGKVTSSSSPSPTKTEAPETQPPNRFEQAISNFLTPSAASGGYEHSLKRLADQERPLVLQLEFDSLLYGAVDIVLQENDNADIAWDAFEAPELCNFLKILDREEAEHLEHVRSHFVELKRVMRALVELEERKCRGGAVDIPHPRASLPLSSGGGAEKTDTNSPAAVPVGS